MIVNINFSAFKYIPNEFKEQCYNSMKRDIYYFYTGIMTTDNEEIICIDGDRFNLSKNNLVLINKII
jgi:hypothetical protein